MDIEGEPAVTQQTWTAVDDYFNGLLVEEDEALLAAAVGRCGG